jgi:hypothetical protein
MYFTPAPEDYLTSPLDLFAKGGGRLRRGFFWFLANFIYFFKLILVDYCTVRCVVV